MQSNLQSLCGDYLLGSFFEVMQERGIFERMLEDPVGRPVNFVFSFFLLPFFILTLLDWPIQFLWLWKEPYSFDASTMEVYKQVADWAEFRVLVICIQNQVDRQPIRLAHDGHGCRVDVIVLPDNQFFDERINPYCQNLVGSQKQLAPDKNNEPRFQAGDVACGQEMSPQRPEIGREQLGVTFLHIGGSILSLLGYSVCKHLIVCWVTTPDNPGYVPECLLHAFSSFAAVTHSVHGIRYVPS